ncbi:class I SAM-dependent methyltransferase [Legionella micdadei]|nr:SAM-dependent methyltransferase [Legionella micdadei]ARG98798.1 SAM-dependent methyltransferase [Legionella micdadei]ARH01516.1 SAM-dependent methyltransferase [Legionella micdadei]NSL19435.1 SAM-dependent methyltransferase [Legionella micdadei]
MNLLQLLRTQIAQQGDMPFVEFMQQALYAPYFGYYSAGLQKFGAHGDFVTAPELTPLFGKTLARQCKEVLDSLNSPALFEFGAGSGRLCVDLLTELEYLTCLPDIYYILEVSPDLRQRQSELIQQEIPHLFSRVIWLDRWPKQAFNGVIIANEVLDAMPVHRFLQTTDGIQESFVSLNAQDELIEVFKPCTNQRLLTYIIQNIPKGQIPYLSEVNLFLDDWIKQCYSLLTQGIVLLIDYGFPRHEYYHPDRNTGTLMCHYRHHAHPNPLIHVGEQDITAHVDFTHVAEAAHTAGFHIAGYCNQASFLLANGLLSLLENVNNERERLKTHQAVKQLIQPSEMGELFKVIALTKNIQTPLTGFQLHDKRASL